MSRVNGLPAIVMPMRDRDGTYFAHLETITPLLQRIFAKAIITIPTSELAELPVRSAELIGDSFFSVLPLEANLSVGDEFRALYEFAATSASDSQILHLCFIDRLAYMLQSEHREAFVSDVATLTNDSTPLIYQRTAAAWRTHPSNYFRLEQMVVTASELVLGRSLDLAWCHIAVTAQQLRSALRRCRRHDFILLAEIVLLLAQTIQTRDVDWLAWEDPFILNRDPQVLKAEREASMAETEKRLGYVVPMLAMLQSTLEQRSV